MYAYVTLAEARDHLRLAPGDTLDDDYIQNLIYAASAAVKAYIGGRSAYRVELNADDEPAELDSNYFGAPDSVGTDIKAEHVLPVVKQAVLLMLGMFYRHREGDGPLPDMNYLPRPVTALLYHLRDPAVR